MKPEVEKFLSENDITVILHKHPPVFTCEEAEKYLINLPGLSCKNLFLVDRKPGKYYLVLLPGEKRMDIKKFQALVSAKHLSFANEKELFDILKLTPGSVSPCGLINDYEKKAIFYIDEDVWNADSLNFHPNINDESLVLTQEMFRKFLDKLDHPYKIISM